MPDNSAAIVIDIGTTNCKVTCFSCLDATTLGAHKFVTAKQISPQGRCRFRYRRPLAGGPPGDSATERRFAAAGQADKHCQFWRVRGVS